MGEKVKILICDDEQEIIDLIKLYLDSDIYKVIEANDGLDAMKILENEQIDLGLIDVMMPKMNGLELIKKAKEKNDTPLLIISALDSLKDKLKGYDIGADDYITKPFEPLELVAKIKSRTKSRKEEVSEINMGDLTLDLHSCKIKVSEEIFELTKVEFEVLKLFMESPNRVFTKEQIYRQGWDEEYYINDNSIRVIINRLRSMIGPEKIETIRGLGYRFKV